MTWRDQTIADLRVQEGCKLKAYRDQEGVWTCGYGHTSGVTEGLVIDESQADEWLIHDVQVAETDLVAHLAWIGDAPDAVKRGLLNMCFNLGWPRLSGFKDMLLAGSMGDWSGMAAEALDSKWAKQVGHRAVFIADLFRSVMQEAA